MMEIVGEFMGNGQDKSIWRYFRNHWQIRFPSLGSRSTFLGASIVIFMAELVFVMMGILFVAPYFSPMLGIIFLLILFMSIGDTKNN